MGRSSVTSSSKSWQTVVIVLIISCGLHVSLSASHNRFHRKRNTESRNQEPVASTGEGLSRDEPVAVRKRSMKCKEKENMDRSPPPDLPHRMFVYGSLKTGQPNHDGLTKGKNGMARFLGHARTRAAYPLVIFTKWKIPFLLHVQGKGKLIVGEVYDVDDKCFKWLDKLEHYPELYVRERITVDLLSNDVTGSVPNSVSSNASSTEVCPDTVSSDVNESVRPCQVTCWVYFLKNFPPRMLDLETFSTYDSNGFRPNITEDDGILILEEIRRIVEGHEEKSQL